MACLYLAGGNIVYLTLRQHGMLYEKSRNSSGGYLNPILIFDDRLRLLNFSLINA